MKNPKNRRFQEKVEARPVLEELREPCYPLSSDVSPSKSCWGKAAAGAATFFLAIHIGGVVESQTTEQTPGPLRVVTQTAEAPVVKTPQQKQNTMIVAPLFEHGEGRGATGCVVVAPPVFFSEEEAMQIIKEELAKHGVKLGKGGELKDVMVKMPVTNKYAFLTKEDGPHAKESKTKKERFKKPKPFDVDAMDQDKNIAIEFVSKEDFVKLHENDGHMCTVAEYNPKSVAKYLTKEAAGKGQHTRYLGVFYDPVALRNAFEEMNEVRKIREKRRKGEKIEEKRLTWEERQVLAQKKAEKQLRQQVTDFTKWLDKQGVDLSKEKTEKEKQDK